MDEHDWSSYERSRRLHDPSHAFYVSTTSDDAPNLPSDRATTAEFGPKGKLLLYGAFLLAAASFGTILIFGTH